MIKTYQDQYWTEVQPDITKALELQYEQSSIKVCTLHGDVLTPSHESIAHTVRNAGPDTIVYARRRFGRYFKWMWMKPIYPKESAT